MKIEVTCFYRISASSVLLVHLYYIDKRKLQLVYFKIEKIYSDKTDKKHIF